MLGKLGIEKICPHHKMYMENLPEYYFYRNCFQNNVQRRYFVVPMGKKLVLQKVPLDSQRPYYDNSAKFSTFCIFYAKLHTLLDSWTAVPTVVTKSFLAGTKSEIYGILYDIMMRRLYFAFGVK